VAVSLLSRWRLFTSLLVVAVKNSIAFRPRMIKSIYTQDVFGDSGTEVQAKQDRHVKNIYNQ
jgi:hypothetical protein